METWTQDGDVGNGHSRQGSSLEGALMVCQEEDEEQQTAASHLWGTAEPGFHAGEELTLAGYTHS